MNRSVSRHGVASHRAATRVPTSSNMHQIQRRNGGIWFGLFVYCTVSLGIGFDRHLVDNICGCAAAGQRDPSGVSVPYRGNFARTGELHSPIPIAQPVFRWHACRNRPLYGTPRVCDTRVLLFCGSGRKHDYRRYLLAVDRTSGTECWEVDAGFSLRNSVAAGNGFVCFTAEEASDARLVAVDFETGQQKWEIPIERIPHYPPAIGRDHVYHVGSRGKSVHARDLQTGAETWSFQPDAVVSTSPVVHEDQVLVGAIDGNVYVLSRRSGELDRKIRIGVPIRHKPIVVGTDIVVGADDGVYSVSLETGQVNWVFRRRGGPTVPSIVQGGVVLVGFHQGVACLDEASGELHWHVQPVSFQKVICMTVDSGVIHAAYDNGGVQEIMLASGEVRWHYRFSSRFTTFDCRGDTLFLRANGGLYAMPVNRRPCRWSCNIEGRLSAEFTIANDTVFVGSTEGELHAIDLTSGRHKGSVRLTGTVTAPVCPNGDTILVPTVEQFHCISASTGRPKWQTGGLRGAGSSPLVVGNTVIIGGPSRHIFALAARSGRLRWKAPTRSGFGGAPALENGSVFMADRFECLWAVDVASGRPKWKVAMGSGGGTVAVANGRVFVVTASRNLYAFDADTGRECWRYLTKNGSPPPTVSQGIVVVRDQRSLVGLDATTGAVRWRSEDCAGNCPPMASQDSFIVPCSQQHLIRVLDARTGRERWAFPAPYAISSVVVAGNRMVFAQKGIGDGFRLLAVALDEPDSKAQRQQVNPNADGP